MQLGYFGRIAILFPVALSSALAGGHVVHLLLAPDLVRRTHSPSSTGLSRTRAAAAAALRTALTETVLVACYRGGAGRSHTMLSPPLPDGQAADP
jgi:hypothetical protein